MNLVVKRLTNEIKKISAGIEKKQFGENSKIVSGNNFDIYYIDDDFGLIKIKISKNDLRTWIVRITKRVRDPEPKVYYLASPYAGLEVELKIHFPEGYPTGPPGVTFRHSMIHPNIYSGGGICLDILREGNWNPSVTIISLIQNIMLFLDEPNSSDAANSDSNKKYQSGAQKYFDEVRKYYRETITRELENLKFEIEIEKKEPVKNKSPDRMEEVD